MRAPASANVVSVGECLEPLPFAARRKIQLRDYGETGRFPIVDQGRARIAGWTDDEAAVIREPLPVIVFGDHTRALKFVDFPFARGADGTQVLRPRADIDPLYFFYACKALDLPARGYNRHFAALRSQLISLPPSSEQTRIGGILRRLEYLQSVTDRAVETAGELKRAAIEALFLSGSEGNALKQTEIGLMPEHWEVTTVGAHASVVSKGTSPRWLGFEYAESGVLFIRSQNVGYGVLDLGQPVFLEREWNLEQPRSILSAGDILITLVGYVGRVALGDSRIEGANCNQAVCFVRVREEAFIGGFLVGFLLSSAGQRQMQQRKKEVARANLSLQDVRSLVVPRPPKDEQRKIAAVLGQIDATIQLNKRKKAILEDLFRVLLSGVAAGKADLANLDIASAAAPGGEVL